MLASRASTRTFSSDATLMAGRKWGQVPTTQATAIPRRIRLYQIRRTSQYRTASRKTSPESVAVGLSEEPPGGGVAVTRGPWVRVVCIWHLKVLYAVK